MDLTVFWNHPYWNYADKIGIAAALIAMVFSFLIWLNQKRKERRDNTLIYIRLQCDDPQVIITMQGQIRRKNLTRAEILGLLGMLPMKNPKERYELSNISKSVFFEALELAQIDNNIAEVVIPCEKNEITQFDLIKIKNVCDIQGSLPTI